MAIVSLFMWLPVFVHRFRPVNPRGEALLLRFAHFGGGGYTPDWHRCLRSGKRLRQCSGNRASGKSSAEGKPHDWPEAVCGRNSAEIQTWHRRLEIRRKHRCAIESLYLRTNFRVQELQSLQIRPVTRRRNHVLGDNLALAAICGPNLEMHPAVPNIRALRRTSQMQGQLPDYFVPNGPSPRRAKSSANDVQAERFRQVVK